MSKEEQMDGQSKIDQLVKFINVPRYIKSQLGVLVHGDLEEEEKEDIAIICMFFVDETLSYSDE